MNARPSLLGMGGGAGNTYALTISSNGDISPDETLRVVDGGHFMQLANISNASMKEFFDFPIMKSIQACGEHLAKECLDCCWRKICNGGAYTHRYSKGNGFDNPSALCSGLKLIYSKITAFLLTNGYPIEKVRGVLDLTS